MKKDLSSEVRKYKDKYNLTDCSFDAEYIYQLGDLSELLKDALTKLLPEFDFSIDEQVKNGRYSATIANNGVVITDIYADIDSDWLPDDFWELFDSIPSRAGINKVFCSINPQLTGQGAWYLCGSDANVREAKKDGLPIVFYGDNIFEMDLSDFE